MSIFKRIFKEKVECVRKEVDDAEGVLQKAEEKIKVLKQVCKISLLREELANLITELKLRCKEQWDYDHYGCDDKIQESNAKKIKTQEKEIGHCIDELLKAKPCCRNCS